MGRVLEQGPVLVITFTAQQVSNQFVLYKYLQHDPMKIVISLFLYSRDVYIYSSFPIPMFSCLVIRN